MSRVSPVEAADEPLEVNPLLKSKTDGDRAIGSTVCLFCNLSLIAVQVIVNRHSYELAEADAFTVCRSPDLCQPIRIDSNIYYGSPFHLTHPPIIE